MKPIHVVLLFFIFTLHLSAQTTMSQSEFEAEIFRLTNLERVKHSLPPLLPEEGLVDLARYHAQNMARYDFFDHFDHEKLDVGGRKKKYYNSLVCFAIGENLAFHEHSQRKYSAQSVVTGWMNSPGHRANILSPSYTHLGVAIARMGDRLYSVQNFAHPLVKLLPDASEKAKKTQAQCLEFLYLDGQERSSLQAFLILPDKEQKVFIDERTYMKGVQPLKPIWGRGNRFHLEIPTHHGKGKYKLAFGYDGSMTVSDFEIRIK